MRNEFALVDAASGDLVSGRITAAKSFFSRTKGLMGRKALAPHEGLWIDRCAAIHTFFMRTRIDAVFLSGEGRVLRAVRAIAPWRPYIGCRGAASVIELAPGTIDRVGILPGDHLALR
jgi:uncharacterized membrane protein (UPF0127 family)